MSTRSTCTGGIGADPVGAWLSDRSSVDVDAGLATLAAWAPRLAVAPAVRLASIDGTRFHDAGASDAQELGYALSRWSPTWRVLADDGGLGAAAALGRFELRLAATVDQFATIAKFRAVRRLWARVAEVAGVPEAAGDVSLHAVTSRAMITRYDPAGQHAARHRGVLRRRGRRRRRDHRGCRTTSSWAAATATLGRRLARNTQSILAMESHLTRVVDPAGGSWYVERRTDQLADAAWDVLPRDRGAPAGSASPPEWPSSTRRIAATWAARDADVDHRRAPLTGLTEFPDVDEPAPAGRSDRRARATPACRDCVG